MIASRHKNIVNKGYAEYSAMWWLHRIPDPDVRKRALFNTAMYYPWMGNDLVRHRRANARNAIAVSFGWSSTPEGRRYWETIPIERISQEPYD